MASKKNVVRQPKEDWSLLRGWTSIKNVGIEKEDKHRGKYKMVVPPAQEELVVKCFGPKQPQGILHYPEIWGNGRKHDQPAGTNMVLTLGGWRHTLWGFFDLPCADVLKDVLESTPHLPDAILLAQQEDNRIFGYTEVVSNDHNISITKAVLDRQCKKLENRLITVETELATLKKSLCKAGIALQKV